MNAEQIEKLIEVLEVGRDAAHEVAQRFHDEMKGYREAEHKQVDKDVACLNEAIAMLEAERATQPAQDRCCDHDSDCAVHNAPAYPVGPCDCALSGKPAQDQVAAVRAVLSDEQIKDVAIDYAKHVAADIYDVTQYDCAEDFFNCVRACILAAAAPAPDHETIARQSGELICTACGTTAPAPQPSGSIDTPEFRQKLATLVDATHGAFDTAIGGLIAHIDAKLTQAQEENYQQGYSAAFEDFTKRNVELKARATDSEEKLTAIRRPDAQIIQRAGEIFGFKPHEMGELVKSQYLDFARWAAGEE